MASQRTGPDRTHVRPCFDPRPVCFPGSYLIPPEQGPAEQVSRHTGPGAPVPLRETRHIHEPLRARWGRRGTAASRGGVPGVHSRSPVRVRGLPVRTYSGLVVRPWPPCPILAGPVRVQMPSGCSGFFRGFNAQWTHHLRGKTLHFHAQVLRQPPNLRGPPAPARWRPLPGGAWRSLNAPASWWGTGSRGTRKRSFF